MEVLSVTIGLYWIYDLELYHDHEFPVSVDELTQQIIDRFGTNLVLIMLLAPLVVGFLWFWAGLCWSINNQ